MKYKILVPLLIAVMACQLKPIKPVYLLTSSEKKICDTLQLDTTIIQDIRTYNANLIEPFHYSLSKMYQDSQEIELDPIYLKGLVFGEENSKSFDLVFKLKDQLKQKGYSIFVLENNFNLDNELDRIGVLKTTDKYTVLKQINTDGINYNITNDSLLKIIKQFDDKYSLELIGASGDWCEFIIHKEPNDWLIFAKEVYQVCPDVIDQGAGNLEALAEEMKNSKRLYLWWD